MTSHYTVSIMNYIKVLILIVVSFTALSCNKNKTITVSGVIDNLNDSEILVSYFSGDSLNIDTVWSKEDGRFSYKNDLESDLMSFSFYFNNQTSHVSIFASTGDKIKMRGDALLPELVQVKGNQVNNDLSWFKNEFQDLIEHRALLRNNLTSKGDSLPPLSVKEEISKIKTISNQLIQHAEEFIEDNPEKLSSLVLLNEFFATSENNGVLERMMNSLKPELLKTKMGLNLENYLKKINRSAEGAVMPFFELKDLDGEKISSHDYRGQQLLISFFSSDESDSEMTIETLKEVYNRVDTDSVKFLSVYIDTFIYPDERYLQDSLKWEFIVADKSWASDIVNDYNVEFVPHLILISPKGVIEERDVSLLTVEDKLKIK